MHCANCGTKVLADSQFCPACGNSLQQMPTYFGLRGFSPRINDPAFAKYIKNSNRWATLFSLILAFIAVIGFYIGGQMGWDSLENPQALYIGLAIGSMFIIIALFQVTGRKRSSTWDGTVTDRKIKKKTHHDQHSVEEYLEYSVIIRSDQGKKHTLKTRNTDVLYNYFNIGDRVRHHAGLKSYEKYDKTGDRIIPCNACGTICDITADVCYRCKCPLLK